MKGAIVDDAAAALRLAEKALERLGHTAVPTSDPAQFAEIVLRGGVEFQVVDHKMPNAEESLGVADGPAIVALTAARGPSLPTVFLTGWKADCEARIAEFDPRINYAIVEKPTETDVEAWAERLAPAVATIARDAASEHPKLGLDVGRMRARFFHLSATELHALEDRARSELEEAAVLELHDPLAEVWDACDSDWIKLQRVGDIVLVTDRGTDDDMPYEDDVAETETHHGYGALVVGRPLLVEEVSDDLACSPGGTRNWKRYPYVRLTIGDIAREFHIDTGNPTSCVGSEVLSEAGLDLPTARRFRPMVVKDLTGRKLVRREFPLRMQVSADGPDGNVEVEVNLRAILEWAGPANFLNAPCLGQRCPESEGRQCGRRMGLMGRDLLYAINEGVWMFSPVTGQFSPVARVSDRLTRARGPTPDE